MPKHQKKNVSKFDLKHAHVLPKICSRFFKYF